MSLPTISDLKNYLRVQTTAEDSVITAILASVTARARALLDRPIEALERTYTVEDRRSASLGLSRLSYDPIPAAFIRVPDTPIDLNQSFSITDRNGTLLDPTTYRVDGQTGVIRGCAFAGFPYTIVCTTGLMVLANYSTDIEPCINATILDLGADLYQRRNPAATDENDGAGGSVRYGRSEETIPARALELLAPWRRVTI